MAANQTVYKAAEWRTVSPSGIDTLVPIFFGQTYCGWHIVERRDADIPFYVSDCTEVRKAADWKSQRALSIVLEDLSRWLVDHRDQLEPVLR